MQSEETTPLLRGHNNEEVNQTNQSADVIIYLRRWYILGVFSLLAFIQAAVWNTWAAIATVCEPAMGWFDSDIALLTNWGTFTFILSAFFFAWLMDVKGLRWAGLAAAILTLAATLLRCITIQQPTATWLIHVAQILNGFAGPVIMGMPPLISATWFPVHERITSTAIACAMNGLGVAASFIVGPLVVPAQQNNGNSSNSATTLPSPDISKAQHDIMQLMYIECGFTAVIASAMFIYFPPKPPSPPSITASITRVNFGSGLKDIMKNKGFWILGGAYAISTGVNNSWNALLDVILKSIGISQSTSGYIAFTGIVAGNIGGVFISFFARTFSRQFKLFLVVLYVVGALAFLFFTLQCSRYIPFYEVSLYLLIAIGSVCLISAVPLLYELICEVTYPVAEGLTNTMVTMLNSIVGAIFILFLMIPFESKMWMNWTMFATTAVCIPVFVMYKERYNRLDIDTGQTSQISINRDM